MTQPSPILRPEATVTLDTGGTPQTLEAKNGTITLDDAWSPYGQGSVDVSLTSPELAELLDARETQRVVVDASEAIGGSARSFDLCLRGRRVDHKSKTVVLDLATDEALLIDKRRLATTPDATPRTYEASFRDVCGWALGKIGATLEAGTDDADLTAYWEVTNLHPNPTCAVGVGSYAAGGGCTIAWNSATGWSGAGFCRATMSAASGAVYLTGNTTGGYSITPGHTYTLSFGVRHSHAGASLSATLRWFNSESVLIQTDTSPLESVPTAWGARREFQSVAPPGAARVVPFVSVQGSADTRNLDIDAVLVTEGKWSVTYFDPTLTIPGYTIEWADDPHASQSTRTPDVERHPSLFEWKPGQSLWDFLQPLMEASGLRLFCDEARRWRLVHLSTYEVPGQIVVQEKVNAIEGEDEITRNDNSWATGVVCHYEWPDADGITREAYDFAGTDEKVVTVEYDTPFPGPGAAASLLQMFSGRGRIQNTSRLIDYAATPGMGALITLPGTHPQSGKLSAVTFHLKGGVMDPVTRGLTEVTPGSWSDVDADLEWDDTVTTDVDWKDWT